MDLPNSYYVGQEYIEDPEEIIILIQYKIRTPILFSDFDIKLDNLEIYQCEHNLIVQVTKNISKKLFFDLINSQEYKGSTEKKAMRSSIVTYIIGYIKSSFQIVIDNVYAKKYSEGHILLLPISLYDIYGIIVANKEDKSQGSAILEWPAFLSGFPPSVSLAESANFIYIRDLLDAMSYYFTYSIDECIRKIITSLENFFIEYNLKKKTFRNTIKKLVIEDNFQFKAINLNILTQNIFYIYEVRNSIVHNRLRIKPSQKHIAKKAIGTLIYLFQNKFTLTNQLQYITTLCNQFLILDTVYGGIDLDEIWGHNFSKTKEEADEVHSFEEFENVMFKGLEISEKEKIFYVE